MSGFFDGILLHQVLQWHHLLSLVPGEPFGDPRVQVYADGMFHALMYGLMLVGLWFLWRGRGAIARPRVAKGIAVAFIAGFGAWNVADVALFHWVLHLHNIRLDVPDPLAWDIGWLAAFGITPLLGAALLRRGWTPREIPPKAAVGLALITVLAGVQNLDVRPSGGQVAVLFRPGLTETARVRAISEVGGALVGRDPSGDLLVIATPPDAPLWRLYLDGALVVGGTAGGGCLTGARVAAPGAASL